MNCMTLRGRGTSKQITTPRSLFLFICFPTLGRCNIWDYIWQSPSKIAEKFGHQAFSNPQRPGIMEQPHDNQAYSLNQHIPPDYNQPFQLNSQYAPIASHQNPAYAQNPQNAPSAPNLYPSNSQPLPLPASAQGYPQPQYPGMAPYAQYPGLVPNPQYPAMAPNPQYPAMAPNPQYPAMAPNPQFPAMAPHPQYPAMAPNPQNPAMAPNPQYPAMGYPQPAPAPVQPQYAPAPPVKTESAFSRYLRYAAYGMSIIGDLFQIRHNHRQQETLSQIEQHHRQLTPHGGMYPMPHREPALPHTIHHHHEVHVIPHPHGQHVIPHPHGQHVIPHPHGQNILPRAQAYG